MRNFWMRRGTPICFVFILLVIIGACFVALSMEKTSEHVEYSEQLALGDRSYLDGVDVSLYNIGSFKTSGDIVWENTLSFQQNGWTISSDAFCSKEFRADREIIHDSYPSICIYESYSLENLDLQVGRYRLKDYAPYVPLEIGRGYVGDGTWQEYEELEWYQNDSGNLVETEKKLNEKIKFHSFENAYFEVEEDGWTMWGYERNIDSVVSKEHICIWVKTQGYKESENFDDSLLPGGYGVYMAPINRTSKGEGRYIQIQAEYDFDHIVNICPMKITSVIEDVAISKDERYVFILESNEKVFILHSYDTSLGKEVDSRIVRDISEEGYVYPQLTSMDKGVVICTENEMFAYVIDENQNVNLCMHFDKNQEERTVTDRFVEMDDKSGIPLDMILWDTGEYYYDGNRLVKLCYYKGLLIAVFAENDLKFFGLYDNSIAQFQNLAEKDVNSAYMNGTAGWQIPLYSRWFFSCAFCSER